MAQVLVALSTEALGAIELSLVSDGGASKETYSPLEVLVHLTHMAVHFYVFILETVAERAEEKREIRVAVRWDKREGGVDGRLRDDRVVWRRG